VLLAIISYKCLYLFGNVAMVFFQRQVSAVGAIVRMDHPFYLHRQLTTGRTSPFCSTPTAFLAQLRKNNLMPANMSTGLTDFSVSAFPRIGETRQ
jgi:hypothetical protein